MIQLKNSCFLSVDEINFSQYSDFVRIQALELQYFIFLFGFTKYCGTYQKIDHEINFHDLFFLNYYIFYKLSPRSNWYLELFKACLTKSLINFLVFLVITPAVTSLALVKYLINSVPSRSFAFSSISSMRPIP